MIPQRTTQNANYDLNSRAFERAALKSESYRVFALLFVLGVIVVFAVVRGIATQNYVLLIGQLVILAFVIAHESVMLRAIKAALRDDETVVPELWVFNIFIESQLPTLALFVLLLAQWMTPYQVLVAPAIAIYFLFITLSTLRLRPGLTLFTGFLSALGYLFVSFYVHLRFSESATGQFPFAVYVVYALLILAAGIIAALVARQVRGYVTAALREAKLQGELERINHDLDIARSIQRGLLPASSPQLDNFEIAGWNQPANETGGDYFDWQLLPDGQLAISVADATGHGIGPALVGALCRAYARASFLADQNQILERLNSLLASDLAENRFVTFAVIFLNPITSEIKVLSAGHGPILWYQREANKLEDVEAQGIPLGMIAGISYEDSRMKCLNAGDMMVLVTDGFYEWQNPESEEFGLERLKETIQQARDCSAEEVIARLCTAVREFSRGTEQQDDLTAVVLKRKNTVVTERMEATETELVALTT